MTMLSSTGAVMRLICGSLLSSTRWAPTTCFALEGIQFADCRSISHGCCTNHAPRPSGRLDQASARQLNRTNSPTDGTPSAVTRNSR